MGVSECRSVGVSVADGKDGRNGTDWANGKSQMANGRIGAFAFLVIANRFRPPRKALVRSGGKLGCEGMSFVSGAFFAFFFYNLEVVLFLLDELPERPRSRLGVLGAAHPSRLKNFATASVRVLT